MVSVKCPLEDAMKDPSMIPDDNIKVDPKSENPPSSVKPGNPPLKVKVPTKGNKNPVITVTLTEPEEKPKYIAFIKIPGNVKKVKITVIESVPAGPGAEPTEKVVKTITANVPKDRRIQVNANGNKVTIELLEPKSKEDGNKPKFYRVNLNIHVCHEAKGTYTFPLFLSYLFHLPWH